MSFGEAVSTCLRKFADPNGRASRAEFWYFYLALLLGNVGAFLLATLVSIVVPPVGGGLFLLILVANVVSLIPLLCVQARRFHDQDLSGALVLQPVLPGDSAGLHVPGGHARPQPPRPRSTMGR
ncbi:DUF805 domain-containing protein [Propionibacterium freudenreichii]|uniref:DUF805 domain-containing protein n=1 Tax=Propionibacterium freudenreichii TaxID=1744 RepID=UPI00110A0558|nr:DUF805 domain-containing protein [Propionibacterium freudenreichii]MDK9351767.1 DUF805 domain-containing protein [Propionibacterium freudenreichii]